VLLLGPEHLTQRAALLLALAAMVSIGAVASVRAVFRQTILQSATPAHLRGRLQGVFIVVVAGGPRLGDVESGAVAGVFGERVSIVSGGLLCIAGVFVLSALFPSFKRYRRPEPGEA